jgi:cytochrome c oxidase assembly factor CtaG
VTGAATAAARRAWVPGLRRYLAVLGVVLWIVALVPPLTTWTHRYEFVQAIQFATFGFWVPALVATGAPWQRWHLVRLDGAGDIVGGMYRRRRRVSQGRVIAEAILFIALSITWRLAPMVNALSEHGWIVVVEAITLSAAGVAVMCDLIESPPLHPGVSRPYRIGVTAAVMWSAWVFAYVEAMSGTSWYRAFRHVIGRNISVAADQQFSAASVWLMTAAVFIPIIFWNLVHWLQSEEDPDDELYQMVRAERTRGFFGYRSN